MIIEMSKEVIKYINLTHDIRKINIMVNSGEYVFEVLRNRGDGGVRVEYLDGDGNFVSLCKICSAGGEISIATGVDKLCDECRRAVAT